MKLITWSSPPPLPLSSFLRMECLLSLQRYDECLAMINHELITDESNPTLYVLRAQINILFGNVRHSSTLHLSSLPPLLSLPSLLSLPTLLFHFSFTAPCVPPPPTLPQSTLGYHDVCSALQIDPLHQDATKMKKQLQKDALAYKNQVRIVVVLMSHTLKHVPPCYISLPLLPPPTHTQAVHHSLVGRKTEALKKITAAIETDPAVPEYHTFR